MCASRTRGPEHPETLGGIAGELSAHFGEAHIYIRMTSG